MVTPTDRPTNRANIEQSAFSKFRQQKKGRELQFQHWVLAKNSPGSKIATAHRGQSAHVCAQSASSLFFLLKFFSTLWTFDASEKVINITDAQFKCRRENIMIFFLKIGLSVKMPKCFAASFKFYCSAMYQSARMLRSLLKFQS